MAITNVTPDYSVDGQIDASQVADIKASGFKTIICNRPDEESGAVAHAIIKKEAKKQGLAFHYMPIDGSGITADNVADLVKIWDQLEKPVLAYCRSGRRAEVVFQQAQLAKPVTSSGASKSNHAPTRVVIVGGGAAGISTASSLMERSTDVAITIIDPSDVHAYQPGWTMVGGGIFNPEDTVRTMASQIPGGVKWIKKAVTGFQPKKNQVLVEGGEAIDYDQLVVCPGLTLDWQAIDGLEETLGRNGVTSNYRFDLAPYTWELVTGMKSGKAIFTQPAMPIKCAGAPQKAMYLSSDHWLRQGVLDQIDIDFCNAGGVLFGVKEYVPALMEYVEKYNANLSFNSNLIAIDGKKKTATFAVTDADGKTKKVKKTFDMIHVCPPQKNHAFVSESPLADGAGWVDVDQASLQHKRYANIWSLGDAANTPNAKTAAAVRQQAPIVAENLLAVAAGSPPPFQYTGYGSCPLTVERGRIVLAEFGYRGALQPTFPKWMLNGQRPSRLAWFLKEKILPSLYWHGMLKGKEWMAKPKNLAS